MNRCHSTNNDGYNSAIRSLSSILSMNHCITENQVRIDDIYDCFILNCEGTLKPYNRASNIYQLSGDTVIRGNDNVYRKLIFNENNTISWEQFQTD